MTTALPFAVAPVTGGLVVPGSKSETNRALLLAALGDGPSRVTGALDSRDSRLMIDALRALGVSVVPDGPALVVTPPPRFTGADRIDCGLAGTVMRFVPPLAALADGASTFVGDPHASERPMGPLLDGLRQLGADVDGDSLPFRVDPPETLGDRAEIDASGSSQFVSGLLLIAPRLPHGLTLRHSGELLPSLPHIAMTVAMLRARGAIVETPDERTWVVAPGGLRALDSTVEPDLTNASVFLAAAAVTGGRVAVPGWPAQSLQPGALFLDVISAMGATVERHEGEVAVVGSTPLRGIDVDLTAASELTPVVAALGALATGRTTIRGVAHIRGHETDRLAALTRELRRAGIDAEETPDGLTILGGTPQAAAFEASADHRMVHFAALLALVADGSTIDDMACVGKTMPDFPVVWAGLVT
ncbi:3-phosphoshikimate 1-carboxyvinyltransferase [Tessaracoccus palaemonis]|uniref:3-phosphoshikimate 1-carboxyvinyltransferase n=1 Tax=Tessaracoccus palaemonis TaxID=2829499 RepID=A0ABX8SM72_9ACTN|nr:3-phosphoshikimate 1-carboxyvinyltransferase [Tessaracoccus palaemonis]QXT64044.1 3-phosphoshikimate 1-carboxyvinyltransferase [Tessaracoccus palaemonis]